MKMEGQKKNGNNCEHRNSSSNAGITLVALVVSIVVMLILAGVSINAVVGENGILTQAQNASLATTYAGYLEDLQFGIVISGDTPTCVSSSMKNYISSMKDEDLENFIIIKGELYYIGDDEEAKAVAANVGINTDLSGGSATDVITIVNSVILITDEEEYVGTPLYDKDYSHSTTWNLAIDYDSSNNEITRYGTGYYLLEPGEEYTINGETVTFSDYYVIDYSTNSLISSNNLKNWNFNSTVAVTHDLVLNIDPTNLENLEYRATTVTDDAVAGEGVETTAYQLYEDGTDTGITVYGDVVYDSSTSALVFNESDDNPLITEDGDTAGGGYMKLVSDSNGNEIDFSDGFTFEIYANLSRLSYHNGNESNATSQNSALFCRMSNLFGDWNYALKFITDSVLNKNYNTYILARLAPTSSWTSSTDTMATHAAGEISALESLYELNSDLYITYVYYHYDDSKDEEYKKTYYDDYMIEDKLDKILIYKNGELFGYTYYGSDSYEEGLSIWNGNDCPFFLGITPRATDSNFYYVKGTVYAAHLYTYSFTESEVLENYNTTVQYRNSFK